MRKSIILVLCGMCAALAVFAVVVGTSKKSDNRTDVLCSFYPMYIMTENLIEGTGITASNMTSGLSGCVHDYQVTTKDMKAAEKARVMVINGLHMEHFHEKLAAAYPGLTVIEASKGEAENPHVWMNPALYREQVINTGEQLSEVFTEESSLILANAEKYVKEIEAVNQSFVSLSEALQDKNVHVICYNEAFEVYAEGLGLDIIAVFSLDENELPSAADIANATQKAKKLGNAIIFIEEDKAFHADKIVNETGARVIYLSPVTYGDDSKESYTNLMNTNIENTLQLIK